MDVTQAHKQHIRNLLIHRRKGEAIDYLRKDFHLSYKDAKRLANLIDEDIAREEYTMPAPLINGQRAGRIVGLVFSIIGIFMLVGAIYNYIYNQELINDAVTVNGVVESDPAKPVFKYEYDGQMYYHTSDISSDPPSYTMGEEVEIFVNAENPQKAIVNSFMDRWFLITLLGGMGILFFGMGSLAFFLFKVRYKAPL